MKLGFWNLGMPDWSPEQFALTAASLGYDGVGLRCEKRNGSTGFGPGLLLDTDEATAAGIRASFAEAGVEISALICYNSWVHRDGREDWVRYEEDVLRHAELAERLGVTRIRIGIDAVSDPAEWTRYLDDAWAAIGRALDGAPGISAVVENHPGRPNAEQLLATAERANDPRLGVVYSPDHVLVMQESVLGLVARYAPWIHEISMADRRLVEEGLADFDGRYYTVRYESCRVGFGAVPIAALLSELEVVGFDDYVSLKWEKAPYFGQHLPSGEEVLDEYAELMRSFPQLGRGRAASGSALHSPLDALPNTTSKETP